MHKHKVLLGAILVAISSTLSHGADARVDKPNIVYILADDLGYGDVRCLNPERCKIPTPNIDRFASQGMTFTNAHSGSSVCTPTRYGIMTGRYAWRTRLQSGVVIFGGPTIDAERKTVPGFLREQGYHTAGFGKWHLGLSYQRPGDDAVDTRHASKMPIGSRIVDGPVDRGFDQFYSLLLYPRKWTMTENDKVVHDLELNELLPQLVKRGKAYIAEQADADRPFFMYWAPPVPHIPLAPSDEWRSRSELGLYGDYVMQLDAAIGELMAALDEHGLAEETLVIVTSDNGTAPYPPINVKTNLEQKGHYPSAQYRGYKSDIWEGGHRIAFFARWPGKIKAGSVTDQLTCLNDLFATVADLTGAELVENWAEDSVSILPMLLRQETVDRGPVVHHSASGRFALRSGKWKLIFGPGSGGWSEPRNKDALEMGLPLLQLYDLESDPAEQRNLQAEHPEVVERMTEVMESLISRGRSTPGPELQNDKWSRIVLRKDRKEPEGRARNP